MGKKRTLTIIKAISFILIFCLVFYCASSVLVNPGDFNYQLIAGFYQEPQDTVDIVLIGASPTYTFWSAPLAWGKYGITMLPCAAQGMPIEAVPFYLKEAYKKHKDAYFLITLNALNKILGQERIHWSTDFFPESVNKYDMIHRLTTLGNYSFKDAVPFYVPISQYHSRWNSLTHLDFHRNVNGLKMGMTFSNFVSGTTDLSSLFQTSEETMALPAGAAEALEDTLNFCDENQIKAAFILFPQCETAEMLKQFNETARIVRSRGYECIDLLENFAELGLDLQTDYYDISHTNIHGCLKVTDYLAQYLLEHYDLSEKPSGGGYESWDIAYEKYKAIITPYLTEEELAQLP